MAEKAELWIEWTPLDVAKKWPKNPKTHDLPAIKVSLRRHGFVELAAVDEKTGKLVAGHGRLDALLEMHEAGEQVPKRVRVLPDGRWAMPVLRGARFRNEAEAEAYLVGSNRLTELGGNDGALLVEMLQRINAADSALLAVAGYDDRDLKKLIVGQRGRREDEDDLPETVATRAKLGDVWVLGRHRVACGDATDRAVVDAVLAGERPLLMVTDPPYGVSYDPKWRSRDGLTEWGDLTRTKKVQNDARASWRAAWELSPASVAYVWLASLFIPAVHADLVAVGYEQRSLIIWKKQMAPISRGHYHWQHEPCWYGVRKGAQAAWIGDRKQTTVWDILTKLGVVREKGEDLSTSHGTQKPVECMARPMRNHDGDAFDPFLGSGTTLIAAEQLQRRCFGIDLDPVCVDMAIARWEKFTGQQAVREGSVPVAVPAPENVVDLAERRAQKPKRRSKK